MIFYTQEVTKNMFNRAKLAKKMKEKERSKKLEGQTTPFKEPQERNTEDKDKIKKKKFDQSKAYILKHKLQYELYLKQVEKLEQILQ